MGRYTVYNPYLLAFLGTSGGMLMGFDVSSVSAFVGQDTYNEYFGYPNAVTQGGITGSMAAGSFLACLFAGYLSDAIGRRGIIQISSFVWIIGAAIQCSAINRASLVVGRIVGGVAIGFVSSQVPVYVAEIAPKHIRGRLVGLYQWAITWGIMVMFYISFGCSHIEGTKSFRIAWGLQMVPGMLLFMTTLVLSESPRWLARKERWDEALEIITRVQGKGRIDSPEVMIEIQEIKEAVALDQAMRTHHVLADMFSRRSINRTLVGIWAQIWQQLSGINIMMYYIVVVFFMAGFTGNANLVASSIQYVINCVMTIPALLYVDKWGRRPSLIIGAILMMICMFASGAVLAVYGIPIDKGYRGYQNVRIYIPDDHKPASRALIALSYLFVAFFSATWGPGVWIYCSEIFPLNQRAVANGVCAAANWAFNFALALFVPPAFTNITWKTYMIFGTFLVVMAIHVYLLFPESKGRTLEEMDQVWAEKLPAWHTAEFEPRVPIIESIFHWVPHSHKAILEPDQEDEII